MPQTKAAAKPSAYGYSSETFLYPAEQALNDLSPEVPDDLIRDAQRLRKDAIEAISRFKARCAELEAIAMERGIQFGAGEGDYEPEYSDY